VIGSGISGVSIVVGTAATLALGTISVEVWAPGGAVGGRGFPPAPMGDRMTSFSGHSNGPTSLADPTYDGTLNFVRIQFGGGGGFNGFGREPSWAHDYPRADRNFLEILNELTLINPEPDGYRVLSMSDPEVFRYPMAYIVEVGRWAPKQDELDGLEAYLKKGGFLIVDDFRGRDLNQIEAILDYVLPDLVLMEVPDDHPIFDSFFRIDDPMSLIPPYGREVPMFLGLFEENDPNGRLLAMLNYNNDMAEYWEYSDQGYYPIDLANEAYKFGVNYVVYAMTR